MTVTYVDTYDNELTHEYKEHTFSIDERGNLKIWTATGGQAAVYAHHVWRHVT